MKYTGFEEKRSNIMVLRKLILFFACLVVLILLGAGCKSKVPPQDLAGQPEERMGQSQADAGAEGEVEPEPRADSGVSKPDASVIPEGWQIYRNPEWGIERLAYPEGWHYAELPLEAVGDVNVHIAVFNAEEFSPLLYSDPPYPLALQVVRGRSIGEEIELIDNVESQSQIVFGATTFTRVRYLNEITDGMYETYITEMNGNVYSISGNPKVVTLENVAASFAVEVR